MNKLNLTLLVLIVVVIVAGVGVILFFDKPTQPQQNQSEIETNESDISNWQTYRNDDLGFEFKYPYKVLPYDFFYKGNYGECEYLDEGEDILVPYAVFVGDDEFFLKEEYYYSDSCQKIENSFAQLKKQQKDRGAWHVFIKDVSSKDDLLSIIKERYGIGCGIKEIKETEYLGTFDVLILGDGKDLGETTCPVNYIIRIKYSPINNLVAYWDIGQECTKNITSDFSTNNCLDSKIADSFKFLEK